MQHQLGNKKKNNNFENLGVNWLSFGIRMFKSNYYEKLTQQKIEPDEPQFTACT